MDLSLPIRIIRDVTNRCGGFSSRGIFAEQKQDGSWLTDIDPLVEHIVVEHLREELGDKAVFVREEAPQHQRKTVGEICEAEILVTIDGIDGTGRFIRQMNQGISGATWLVAMTAVYRRNSETGNFRPILAFAYQPTCDTLFALVDAHAMIVENPLRQPDVSLLNAEHLQSDSPKLIVDSYLTKATCPHRLTIPYVDKGPGGFAFASLLQSCRAEPNLEFFQSVNCLSFHYMIWDFGLWPVLTAAGLQTVDFEDFQTVHGELNPRLFGQMDEVPGKILRPLIIAPEKALPSLVGAILPR
jgi:hypothetical protein